MCARAQLKAAAGVTEGTLGVTTMREHNGRSLMVATLKSQACQWCVEHK